MDSMEKGQAHSRGWLWFTLIVVVVALGVAWLVLRPAPPGLEQARKGGGRGAPTAPGRPTPVVAVAAKSADVNVYLNGLGSVTPLNTVSVKSRVDGQLMKVLFTEGQLVKAGQVLAEIDPRPFQVQLEQAEGQLGKDEALLKNAQADLERYRVLFAQESLAKQQLDTQASLVRQYEATLKVDRAAIDNARLQLAYSRVTAPLTGRIGLRLVDPGNIVHASDQNGLVVITQLQPIGAVFTLPEDSVPLVMAKLRSGEKLPVQAYDRSGKSNLASGVLLTADNQIDPATGTVKLKAQFANADYQLFPNQFVNLRMLVDVKHGATVVPNAAIQRGTPGTFVYVVKQDRTATVRKVELGPVDGENVAVTGVVPGELVVVDGADRLREGAPVLLPGETPQDPPAGANFKGGKGGKGGKAARAGGPARE